MAQENHHCNESKVLNRVFIVCFIFIIPVFKSNRDSLKRLCISLVHLLTIHVHLQPVAPTTHRTCSFARELAARRSFSSTTFCCFSCASMSIPHCCLVVSISSDSRSYRAISIASLCSYRFSCSCIIPPN